MLERLKTLPLTLVLTILIWMYAEAQTTSPQAGLMPSLPLGPLTQPASRVETLRVPQVPVWVAGLPELLSDCRAQVTPAAVDVTVVGPPLEIERIRTTITLAARPAANLSVHAYVDLLPTDRPGQGARRRKIRYEPPPGVQIQDAPNDIEFRLESRPATLP